MKLFTLSKLFNILIFVLSTRALAQDFKGLQNAETSADDNSVESGELLPADVQILNGPENDDYMRGIEKELPEEKPRKRAFDSISSSRAITGMRQNFFGLKRTPSFDSRSNLRFITFYPSLNKRSFDSISSGFHGGMSQNFFGKKRALDSISSGSHGGMGQNFLGRKRSLDSISSYGFHGGMGQNFLGRKRAFDSISSGFHGGMDQHFLGKKKRFDSITSGFHGGFDQNFLGKKRGFDSISGSSGMGQNFLGKRGFDSISGRGFSSMNQNFLGKKRGFDSISSGFHSMGQNFMGKR